MALLVVVFLTAITATSATAAPTVTTNAATNITVNSATLNATIDTKGAGAFYAFEYGPTTSYGSYSEGGFIEKGAGKPTEVSAPITGLDGNTTYHFRIVAMAGDQEFVTGSDLSFSTLSGIYMTGKASEVEADQPKLAATSYPRSFGALYEGEGFTLFENNEIPVNCPIFIVGGSLTSASNSFELSAIVPFVWNCTFLGASVNVKMNGCSYIYNVANEGPPYAGSVDIACKEPSKRIELVSSMCTVKIPAQTLGGTVNYKTEVFEGISQVKVETAASGMSFEKSGPYCWLLSGTAGFGGEFRLY